VVIPHYNGEEILCECLESLYNSTQIPLEVILVDNASSDESVAMVRERFPSVKIIQLPSNHGFAGGCNIGIRQAAGEYVLILNNDTVHEKGWLELLLTKLESDADLAAVQPKIRSFHNPQQFDYSGAAGGEMDIFAFPFTRGRIVEFIEKDIGQYDSLPSRIFWASGTAFLARRQSLIDVGLFDGTFFAHMEEIDLQWRLQLAGYHIAIEPRAVIYHRSGYTLGAESPLKKYLNHRNSLLMFLANYRLPLTLYLLPIRLMLDYLALGFSLLRLDFGRVLAILKAHGWLLVHPNFVFRKRRHAQSLRKVSDEQILARLYRGTIALSFYIFKKRCFSDLSCYQNTTVSRKQ